MIFDTLKKSKLYDAVKEIRLGILCPGGEYREDNKAAILDSPTKQMLAPLVSLRDTPLRLENHLTPLCPTLSLPLCLRSGIDQDPKFRVVYVGTPEEYERPTLLHMKRSAETDPLTTKYFYFHTKGIRWFGTPYEPFVVDWIKLMLYWNIEKWINAEDIVGKYDTYGCNYHSGEKYPPHYSGNFFWTTSHHLKTLPDAIGPEYNDPEFWLCLNGRFDGKPNIYNAFSSKFEDTMGHYNHSFSENLYRDDIL
jgi:hypothetical protein